MLKRSNLVVGAAVGSTLVLVVGGGAVLARAALRRKRQKGRSGGSGIVVPLRPPDATLAGDEELLGVSGPEALGADWGEFAEALQRAAWDIDMKRPVMAAHVGDNGAGNGIVPPFGEPQFRQPDFRDPDVATTERSRRWRDVGVSAAGVSAPAQVGSAVPVVPAVEPHPVGVEVPVLEVVRDADGRPRRSNYRMKRARQFMADRLREEERWARFMGRKMVGGPSGSPLDTRGVVSSSTLSVNEVDRHDELSQLGQIEMEIFTDGRPSGEHGSVGFGRGRRALAWFRMRVLGERE